MTADDREVRQMLKRRSRFVMRTDTSRPSSLARLSHLLSRLRSSSLESIKAVSPFSSTHSLLLTACFVSSTFLRSYDDGCMISCLSTERQFILLPAEVPNVLYAAPSVVRSHDSTSTSLLFADKPTMREHPYSTRRITSSSQQQQRPTTSSVSSEATFSTCSASQSARTGISVAGY